MKNINLGQLVVSRENPSERYEETALAELVASVKAKGVLMPILVRPKGKNYEVVAGARRVKAAAEAGLTAIPARIETMSDTEAREARIVENLQRKDVHPLEEAEAYRTLIESGKKTKYDITELAHQVGKTESYVRDRLGLTNLIPKAKDRLRRGDMKLSHAVLIARVDEERQKKVIKLYGSFGISTRSEVAEVLQEFTFQDLMKRPPWKNDEEMKATLDEGDIEGEQVDLFGKKATDEYRDPVAFARKMAAYIQIKLKEAEEAGAPLVKISTEWGDAKQKGVLSRRDYLMLPTKEQQAQSANPQKAIVVEGELGKTCVITTEPDELRTHQHPTSYKLTDKEKAERKREREKAQKEREAYLKLVGSVVEKTEKSPAAKDKRFVEAMFGLTCAYLGTMVARPICKRRGIEGVRKSHSMSDGTYLDYKAALDRAVNKMSAAEKLGLMVEVFCTNLGQTKEVKKAHKRLS